MWEGYGSTLFLFFFKQKTAYELRISDWSSDVCSSDLVHQSHIQGEYRCLCHKPCHRWRPTLGRHTCAWRWGCCWSSRSAPAARKKKPRSPARAPSRPPPPSRPRRRPRPSPTKRSEEHTSEPKSLMRISYAVYCLQKK